MRATVAALGLIGLLLPTVAAAQDRPILKDLIDPALNAWASCVGEWTSTYSLEDMSLNNVVDATMASCAHHRDKLSDVFRQYAHPTYQYHDFLDDLDADFRGMVLTLTVAIRKSHD